MYEEFIGKKVSVIIRETVDKTFQKDGKLIAANDEYIKILQTDGTIVAPPIGNIANLLVKPEVDR